jgi:quinoprotein glucose dehydrogenase
MPSAPGHIRAYDVKTGKKMWVFHTIPHPGEEGYETWENPKAYTFFGGVNCWSGMTLDEEKGILFVPLGSAASDFYGGKRRGSNLYANCLVALDAKSGKKIWHQQIVHHDLWDKDLPTPPILIKVKRNGKDIEAVAQCTKNGQVFVFDRTNGHPLYEVVETKVDTISELDGEKVWPTQPIPIKPAPFCRQNLTIDDINPYVSSEEKKSLTKEMASYRFGNMFIPPGNNPSLVFPGYDGGGEWGGPAFDIKTGVMYVNSNEMAWIMKMIPNEKEKSKDETWAQAGQRLVSRHCFSCHGIDLKGSGNNPSLVDINKKYNKETMLTMINSGRRMMPSFKRLHDEEKNAIASFVLNIKEDMNKKFAYKYPDVSENHMPFKLEEYKKFLTKEGYPAISPPWGTLNAIDLNTGEYKWKIALGEYAKLKEKGIPATGTENYGGPVVTAGGLLFIAATSDNMFRAFDKESGKLLWQYKLPASGFATPSVYSIRGKQYVVIACGGGKLNTKSGDAYVAFCL